jgi:hypothetical protein
MEVAGHVAVGGGVCGQPEAASIDGQRLVVDTRCELDDLAGAFESLSRRFELRSRRRDGRSFSSRFWNLRGQPDMMLPFGNRYQDGGRVRATEFADLAVNRVAACDSRVVRVSGLTFRVRRHRV